MRLAVIGVALGLAACAPVAWSADDPPAVVALTLDTSGSIRPELIEQTRALAVAVLSALPAGSEVALFVFDDSSRRILARTSDPEAVRQALAGVKRAGKFTALYDALYDASRYLEAAPRSRKAIVLVTDGKDENSALQQEDGLKVATTNRIPVFAVGIGRIEEAVLSRIAKLTGGEFAAMDKVDAGSIATRIADLEPVGAPPTPTPPPPPLATPRPLQQPISPGGVPASVIALIAVSVLLFLAAALLVVVRLRPRPAASLAPRMSSSTPNLARDQDASGATMVQRGPDPEVIDRTVVLRTQAALRVTSGPAAGRTIPLKAGDAISVGRSPTNDLPMADPSVSGEHCRIKSEDGAFVVYDVQSTNGTLVNGQQVQRHALRPGDVITLGAVNIKFVRE
jgi:hypothetical protein